MDEKESLEVLKKEPSQLWIEHQEKLLFMGIATFFGIVFSLLGWIGEGKTILIAVATLALNRARSKVAKGK